MTMLSSSTPDLREVLVPSQCRDGLGITGSAQVDKKLPDGKDMIRRPGSAPATKFSDCDSAFEEGGVDSDPACDFLGDIFSVLSIEEDSKPNERQQDTASDELGQPLQNGTGSSDERLADDQTFNETGDKGVVSHHHLGTEGLSMFRSSISAIAEVSSEESDRCSPQSIRFAVPTNTVSRNQPSPLPSKSSPAEMTINTADIKPRQVKCLQMPLVCVSTSDDSSSDSVEGEVSSIALMALRRNTAAYRRRHSLASTTPDQITRMLLSHRRGSVSGLPIPGADYSQSVHSKSTSSHARKPVEKQLSADSGMETLHHHPAKLSGTAGRSDRHAPIPRVAPSHHHGPSGRRASFSRSKSPFREVTPRDNPVSSSTHFRTISLQDATPLGGDNGRQHQVASPRSSSSSLSPRSLSPRPQSPRPRSPRLVQQRSMSPRDEIEMILSGTQPQQSPRLTPPRTPSPRLSPSYSMFVTSISHQERSRSPASKMLLRPAVHQVPNKAPSGPRTRSRSPRPRHDKHDTPSRPPSDATGGSASSARNASQKSRPSSDNKTLSVQGKPGRSRSRSPVPRFLKPNTDEHSQSASVRPQRARSPRPTGQERRSSRRRSSLADKTELLSLGAIAASSQSHRPSTLTLEDSDESSIDTERLLMERRKRRGSRGKIPAVGSINIQASKARQSRRSSICISHPAHDTAPPGPGERADITAKLNKRGRRRSSWAGAGEPLFMTPVSALALLRERNNVEEDTEETRDPYALTLHFITDPGQSHPLRKILRPLIESIVPKLKLFNFVERSESAPRDLGARGAPGQDRDKPALVPTLGVVLLLQEEFGMERILEAQKYLRSEPWELHHRGKVGSNNVPYPTNNQDFYAHQTRLDSALWAVRQVHFGKDRLRFQLFVSDEMWTDSISFYSLLLSRPTHVQKDDFCYFLVFCSRSLNLEVQLALKKLPPGFKPQFLDSTILQFKVEDMGRLVPMLPRVCIPISDKRWQTADPDGNKVLLFKDGDSCTSTTPLSIPTVTSDPPVATPIHLPNNNNCKGVVAPSRETECTGHQVSDRAGHFDEWMYESNLVSAV